MLPLLAAPIALAAALTWLDPETVQPKAKGVCVTEWTGGQRLEIPVEVMGLLDAPAPERRAVLIRLDDPRFAGTGVIAGMSGSPVYVDGKLLGAVAFGWNFAKDPLAGVTPFAAMHDLQGGGAPASGAAPSLARIAALAAGHVEPEELLPRLAAPPLGGPSPLAVGGLAMPDPFGRKLLGTVGLEPVPAGSQAGLAGQPAAGDMIAALLVWGDATLAAGGTVTATEGDRVWAFGHPLFSLGELRLPASRARVLAVETSYQSSFKVFAVGRPFGTFVADRPTGMLAIAGRPPAGVSVTVRLQEPVGEDTWHFRIAEVPVLEPLMVTYLTNSCLTARGAGAGEATARATVRATLADGTSVTVEQAASGLDALARTAVFAGSLVGLLANSPFAHPALTDLEVDLVRDERLRGAEITQVVPDRTTVHPGEELHVAVRLQPDREEARTVTLALRVPQATSPGPIDLLVGDGAAWSEYRMKALGIDPTDFAGQLTALAELEPTTTLVAALETRDRGVAAPGASQPGLPPSYAATLAIGLGKSGLTRLATALVAVTRWSAPYPLRGGFRIPLTVRPAEEVQ